jgi:hypothetical protein
MSEHLPKRSPEGAVVDRINYSTFSEEDQKLMKSGGWDHKDKTLLLNRLKINIEALEDSSLSELELSDKNNALWLWYHHASQFAYTKYQDTETAIAFIDKALEYRERTGLDNQITPLLKLLYSGNISEARAFAESIPQRVREQNEDGTQEEINNPEYDAGLALVSHFEKLNK